MNWTFSRNIAIGLLISFLAFAVAARADDSIHVTGADGTSTDWTPDALKAQFPNDIHNVIYTGEDDKQHKCNCVPLLTVLHAQHVETELHMDPKADPKLKNFNLRYVIVIVGKDGYTTVLSLGELIDDIGNKSAWLALDQDNAPLSERDAPIKLLVPQDGMHARWVHEIATITVVDPTLIATTRPAQ